MLVVSLVAGFDGPVVGKTLGTLKGDAIGLSVGNGCSLETIVGEKLPLGFEVGVAVIGMLVGDSFSLSVGEVVTMELGKPSGAVLGAALGLNDFELGTAEGFEFKLGTVLG